MLTHTNDSSVISN